MKPDETPGKEVILFHTDLPIGGIGNDMVLWTRLAVEAGMKTSLILCTRNGRFLDRVPASTRLTVLGAKKIPSMAWKLARVLRRQPGTTIFTSHYKTCTAAILARTLAGTTNRIVFREPSLPLAYLNNYTLFRYYKLILRRADVALAQTECARAQLISLGFEPERVIVCPNLPPASETPPGPPQDTGRIGFPALVSVGRLTEEKGHERLVRAFPSLLQKHPDATLTLIGDGVMRPRIEQAVKELGLAARVTLTGALPDPIPHLDRADLFVLPSRFEGLSNAVLEALARRRRVISTPCRGGMSEVFTRLKMPDCIIDETDFAESFAKTAEVALSKSNAEWNDIFTRYDEEFNRHKIARIMLAAL